MYNAQAVVVKLAQKAITCNSMCSPFLLKKFPDLKYMAEKLQKKNKQIISKD